MKGKKSSCEIRELRFPKTPFLKKVALSPRTTQTKKTEEAW